MILAIMVLAMSLSAEYILRDSESNTKFEEFEYQQGGILYRFDFKEVDVQGMDGETTKIWKYKELWLPEEISKERLDEIITLEKIGDVATSDNFNIWKNK